MGWGGVVEGVGRDGLGGEGRARRGGVGAEAEISGRMRVEVRFWRCCGGVVALLHMMSSGRGVHADLDAE